jgi:hypothetical protein
MRTRQLSWSLIVVVALSVTPGALAQEDSAAAAVPGRKNPELAGAISVLLPGMGHIYAGETTKGWVLTGMFVAGIGAVAASDIGTTHDAIKAGGWLSVTAVTAVYLYALIDAPFAAIRQNERVSLTQVGGRLCLKFQVCF